MTLTFSNKELQKKGESGVVAALDKEQQRVGGNLRVKAFLCTKSIGVKIVCTVVCKVTKKKRDGSSLFLTFQMVNMIAHGYNSMKITKKPSKTNINLQKAGGFNKVSVKNYLIPPEPHQNHVILHHKQVT